MLLDLRQQKSQLLKGVAETLDISESDHIKAEERYKAVGNWLNRERSSVASYDPSIYPQGSFRLGTVIKPLSNEEEYDIDLVAELNMSKTQFSQKTLKELVGGEIKAYARANNMTSPPTDGRRCWTLNYVESARFHMDILPSVPDAHAFKISLREHGVTSLWSDLSIAITDRTRDNYPLLDSDWPRSNPRGYSEWFRAKMQEQFERRRQQIAESMKASVEEVPAYRVKTPLQRVVQLLKRHRDIRFADDLEEKPISIIITTLAAHAYQNETNIVDAVENIVANMPNFIEDRNGVAWVANPSNPLENFADKWEHNPRLEQNFRKWLAQVKDDLGVALKSNDFNTFKTLLEPSIGSTILNRALERASLRGIVAKNQSIQRKGSLPTVLHRQSPLWPVALSHQVSVSATYKYNGSTYRYEDDGSPLPKHCFIYFKAKTNVSKPFQVYWQVVNTGAEAARDQQLRGHIFPAQTAGAGGLNQREHTAYTGKHWVECYIVKHGVCIARSREFVVNIR